MRVNGSEVKLFAKEKANKFGLTDLCMKAGGNPIKPTAEVDLSMQMATFTMECGLMTRLMERELIPILMVPNMMDIGKRINSMVKA